jgi:hypothetical protein
MVKRRPDPKVTRAPPTRRHEDGKAAQTLRLPAEYWYRVRVLAALRRTTMVGLVQLSLDELFKKLTPQERSALGLR